MKKTTLSKKLEEIMLVFLIVAILLETVGLLPADFEYVEKIISWTALGYVLYKVSLSDIMFGKKHKHIDIILIISYFLLIIKNFVQLSLESIAHSTFLTSFFELVINNAQGLEQAGFIIGNIGIIAVSFYVTYFIEIQEPSILHVLHGPGKHKAFSFKSLIRFIFSLLITIGFFIIVFNLIMEWFLFALDKPIIILVVLLYIFKVREYTQTLNQDHSFYKIGNILDEIYENFIQLFHQKRTLFFGISGMLVLHLLTDLSSFIFPYIFGGASIYVEGFQNNHSTLVSLLFSDYEVVTVLSSRFFLIIGYMMNTVAITFLMLFPLFIWVVLYHKKSDKEFQINNFIISLFFSSLVFYILAPVYLITQYHEANLIGVDIQSQSVMTSGIPLEMISAISLVIFVILMVITNVRAIKGILILFKTVISLIFLGYYTYSFFLNLSSFYIDWIKGAFMTSQYFLLIIFSIMYFISTLFYCGGYFSFVFNTFKND